MLMLAALADVADARPTIAHMARVYPLVIFI
jgi:hypothetical protein